MKRQLNAEEKRLSENSLKRLTTEKEYFEFALKEIEHDLQVLPDKHKWLEYEETKAVKKRIQELKEEIEIDTFNIQALNDQINNGVEEKTPEPMQGDELVE